MNVVTRKPRMDQAFILKLPKQLKRDLVDTAIREERSAAAVVRLALRGYLTERRQEEAKRSAGE
jgi:hypothetical protein